MEHFTPIYAKRTQFRSFLNGDDVNLETNETKLLIYGISELSNALYFITWTFIVEIDSESLSSYNFIFVIPDCFHRSVCACDSSVWATWFVPTTPFVSSQLGEQVTSAADLFAPVVGRLVAARLVPGARVQHAGTAPHAGGVVLLVRAAQHTHGVSTTYAAAVGFVLHCRVCWYCCC